MAKDILKRLEALENEEIIEIEDISMYEREIFGDENDKNLYETGDNKNGKQ